MRKASCIAAFLLVAVLITSALAADTTGDTVYDFYRTQKEAVADVQEGYVFRMERKARGKVTPFVEVEEIPFSLSEDNVLTVKIRSENLKQGRDGIWPVGVNAYVLAELVSPEGKVVFNFEQEGAVLEDGINFTSGIPVPSGEWIFRVGFAYASEGGKPARLDISAQLRDVHEADVAWLMENKLHVEEDR